MPKFIITHGSVFRGKGKEPLTIGDEIELSVEDRNHMDPGGMQLVTPEVFAEMKKQADAFRALEEVQRKEQYSPKKKAPGAGIPEKTLKALADLKGVTTATPAPAQAAAPAASTKGGSK